jgi:hypothetical protein
MCSQTVNSSKLLSKETEMYTTQDGKNIEILANHVRSGRKFSGVCVSACLSYFGVTPNMYTKTQNLGVASSITVGRILRRFGWNFRSRKSIVKKPFKGATTMGCSWTTMIKALKKFNKSSKADPIGTVYYVVMHSKDGGHGMLIGRDGTILCDTANYHIRKGIRKSVSSVHAILPKC